MPPPRRKWLGLSPWVGGLLRFVAYLALLVFLALLVGLDLTQHLAQVRGTEDGLARDQPPLVEPRFGINVSLERYTNDQDLREALAMIRRIGFGTIRQRFSWAEIEPRPGEYRWERWDRVLPLACEQGLHVVAVLDTSPPWARPAWEQDNPRAPPSSPEDYARFAGRFAERYGDWVMAYQIWDQPNTAPHWGVGPVDPAGYVELLRVSSEAVRRVDADALVVAGGLAPNLETGGRNMSDLLFLREIYRRGAGAYFDVLGAKPYGFWSGPDDRRASPDVLNYSRIVLLRREMVRRGEAHKPIWALESGWCALPPDWQGKPSPQGSDEPLVQAERLERAMMRVQEEWPWLGLMCMLHLQPDAPTDDPLWGYALLGPNGESRLALGQVRVALHGEAILYPGLTTDLSPYLTPIPGRSLTDFEFWGTHLLLDVEKGLVDGELIISVDDHHRNVFVDLEGQERGVERVRIGPSVPARTHKVRLRGTADQVAAIRAVQVGHQPRFYRVWAALAAGAAGLVWCGWRAFRVARLLPVVEAWEWLRRRWLAAPGWLQRASMAASYLAMVLLPTPGLRLGGLGLYGLNALLRPDLALVVAAACIPLAPLHVELGLGSFSLTEVALLSAAAARLWGALLAGASKGAKPLQRLRAVRFHWVDWGVLALVLLGLGTSLVAEYQRVAFRELRVVMCEPALLYLLVRVQLRDGRKPVRLVDALWASGLLVALYALARYPLPEGVIEAEGVRRARAFYGSPNNLALYLERVLPLGLSVGLWGRSRWRRWCYGLGALALGAAILLTFSRGALFLGVPAALLALGWLRGGRARWLASGLVLLGVLAIVPLARIERLSFDLSQGTNYLRLSLWQAACDMVRDHPWLGVGLDNFLYYYGDYARPGAEIERWLSHPHNLVLDFWLRLGIGGVVLIVGLLGGFLRYALRAYRALPEGDLRAMTLGFVGGMAAFVAHGSIDSSFFVVELAYWFMFALACVVVSCLAGSRRGLARSLNVLSSPALDTTHRSC